MCRVTWNIRTNVWGSYVDNHNVLYQKQVIREIRVLDEKRRNDPRARLQQF